MSRRLRSQICRLVHHRLKRHRVYGFDPAISTPPGGLAFESVVVIRPCWCGTLYHVEDITSLPTRAIMLDDWKDLKLDALQRGGAHERDAEQRVHRVFERPDTEPDLALLIEQRRDDLRGNAADVEAILLSDAFDAQGGEFHAGGSREALKDAECADAAHELGCDALRA